MMHMTTADLTLSLSNLRRTRAEIIEAILYLVEAFPCFIHFYRMEDMNESIWRELLEIDVFFMIRVGLV